MLVSQLQEAALSYSSISPAELEQLDAALIRQLADEAYGKEDRTAFDDLNELAEELPRPEAWTRYESRVELDEAERESLRKEQV